MNLNTPAGSKIICIDPDHTPSFSSFPLQKGGVYTLKAIDVHSFLSFVHLEEVPDENYNSVMFISCPGHKVPIFGTLLIRLVSFVVKLF